MMKQVLAGIPADFVLLQVILLLGGLPYLWGVAGNLLENYGYPHVEYEVFDLFVGMRQRYLLLFLFVSFSNYLV